MAAPNKLGGKRISKLHGPALSALIAFRMGRATEDHYHAVSAQLMIAEAVSRSVARHRHLIPDIRAAMSTLAGIHERQAQRTVKDAFWSASADELVKIELGCEIAQALMTTTPGPVIRRAMINLTRQLDAALEKGSE